MEAVQKPPRRIIIGKLIASSRIQYCIRIRENFYIDDPRNGNKIKTSVMFSELKSGRTGTFSESIYRVNGQ